MARRRSRQREVGDPKSERPPKPVIGLCGGIGAGKTTVASEFARLGCFVLDSDRHAHQALNEPEVIGRLRRWLGDEVLDEAGRPVRAKIAQRVFARPKELARLNALVHPRVNRMRLAEMAERQDDPSVVAFVMDTPLLFEAGLAGECDATVFIDAPAAQRQRRVARTRGWDADELARRQAHQMDLDAKRARCDHVVRNDGPRAGLARQVKRVLQAVLDRRAGTRGRRARGM